ncbi:hypothetical protein A3A39_02015 [Candidatus Kaiserbacteria bacterium RIFCSPLOWO2_01_FULL_54_13]|uniref:Uncharacterized protein n=1 Tax=Candidatus Kaiserbacteria bacterium RIFCSPLOWO2_01_FULL_54_13 TaxID=1798512 RepID=A0A1F6F0I8_9BACT|nr:MAG: hypothetical protein A3A39_02015 [Candidatus Kaiserbacteria bacterium RIFCSPLOWO2_01_FULL_54_13]
MSGANYKFLTRPNFSLRSSVSNSVVGQRPVSTKKFREWPIAAGVENLGGCKMFPRLRQGFGGQVNSVALVKKI